MSRHAPNTICTPHSSYQAKAFISIWYRTSCVTACQSFNAACFARCLASIWQGSATEKVQHNLRLQVYIARCRLPVGHASKLFEDLAEVHARADNEGAALRTSHPDMRRWRV